MRIHASIARAAAVILLVQCAPAQSVPPEQHGPPPPPFRPPNIAFVHGTVLSAAGEPVAGAEVWIAWTFATQLDGDLRCTLVPHARAVRVLADGRGYYAATLEGSVGPEHVGCVDILASDDDTPAPTAAARHLLVRFSAAGAGGAPRDTLRADMRVPRQH
jgi:hypothetical protein